VDFPENNGLSRFFYKSNLAQASAGIYIFYFNSRCALFHAPKKGGRMPPFSGLPPLFSRRKAEIAAPFYVGCALLKFKPFH